MSDKANEWDLSFCAGVRARREELGLTQLELARLMSVAGHPFHQATVNKIEKGDRKVSVGEAHSLAAALDSTIDALADPPTAEVALMRRRMNRTADLLVDELAEIARLKESVTRGTATLRRQARAFDDATGGELQVLRGERQSAMDCFGPMLASLTRWERRALPAEFDLQGRVWSERIDARVFVKRGSRRVNDGEH